MKHLKLLKGLIIIGMLALLSITISPNAHAQFGYFGPFGPYYPGPFAYGYFPRPTPQPLPTAPYGPYRGAHVLLPSLLPTLTAPAVTPAGLSVTTLVPTAPATITVTLPATALPTLIAPTVATTVPGLATVLLLSGGISTTTLLLLGI